MITVYVPQDQVLNDIPDQYSMSIVTGWTQMQISKSTLQRWQKKEPMIPEGNNSGKTMLYG